MILCQVRLNPTPSQSQPSPSYDNSELVVDSLTWLGKNSHKMPLLSKLVMQILAISESSAESDRRFSTARRITRKDRAIRSPSVEASVIVAQALKKHLSYCNYLQSSSAYNVDLTN